MLAGVYDIPDVITRSGGVLARGMLTGSVLVASNSVPVHAGQPVLAGSVRAGKPLRIR